MSATDVEKKDRSKTPQGFTKAAYIDVETVDSIIEELREGMPMALACRKFGTSTTQFVRRCSRDPEIEARRLQALDEGRPTYQELIRSEQFEHAFTKGNYKALRDLMLMHLPEAAVLGLQKHLVANLDPDDFRQMAARQLGNLSDEDLAQFIEIMEKTKQNGDHPVLELPGGEDE